MRTSLPTGAVAADQRRIEHLFHGLIRSRAVEFDLPELPEMPQLDVSMVTESEARWHPVPGMYGGFSYQLMERGNSLLLSVSSWSRVVGGSGMRHAITASQVLLEAEGID